jgi:putative flippase GtrA
MRHAPRPEEDGRILSRVFCVFLLVGGLSTLLQYVVLLTLVRLFRADAVLASTLGFALSALVNYYLNYRLAFHSSRPHGSALARFSAVALIGLQLNGAIMHGAVHWLSLHYLVAQVIATVLVLFWNFLPCQRGVVVRLTRTGENCRRENAQWLI